MPVVLRSATEADAKHVESLLAELGYPSKEADVRHRLRRSLDSDTKAVPCRFESAGFPKG